MSTLTCPVCGYTGGDTYALRQGFKFAEKVWNYFSIEPQGDSIEILSSTLDTDPEQEATDQRIECGGCGEFFHLPDGFTWDWV